MKISFRRRGRHKLRQPHPLPAKGDVRARLGGFRVILKARGRRIRRQLGALSRCPFDGTEPQLSQSQRTQRQIQSGWFGTYAGGSSASRSVISDLGHWPKMSAMKSITACMPDARGRRGPHLSNQRFGGRSTRFSWPNEGYVHCRGCTGSRLGAVARSGSDFCFRSCVCAFARLSTQLRGADLRTLLSGVYRATSAKVEGVTSTFGMGVDGLNVP